MKNKPPSYQRHRFPSEIISHSVWLYHRFCLSFREVEELLAERGITVTYETIRQWCQKFGPGLYADKTAPPMNPLETASTEILLAMLEEVKARQAARQVTQVSSD